MIPPNMPKRPSRIDGSPPPSGEPQSSRRLISPNLSRKLRARGRASWRNCFGSRSQSPSICRERCSETRTSACKSTSVASQPGKKPAAAFETEGEQALFRREAVIVEGVDAIRHIDVVAGDSCRRLDPAGAEAQVRIALQKREGQHLTGAIGEEVPIGPVPASGRIILYVDLWEEHRADDLGWLQSRLSRTTQSAQLPSVMEQVRECNMQL